MTSNTTSKIKLYLEITAAIFLIIGGLYAAYHNRDFFGFKASSVSIRPFASTKLNMLFLAENDGNAPLTIGRVTGQFKFVGNDSTSSSAPLRLDVREYEEGKTVVAPGESQQLRVFFANEKRLETLIDYLSSVGQLKEARCIFTFETAHYDGSSTLEKLDFDCLDYVAEYFRLRNSATLSLPLDSN